ncbi:hypothetical protein [Kitasatospora purpeofusca]|uniref:hypothetical protein n=1 Tax=Kitasatospora purpeofusca TaxID=67352 RepID=UPI002A59F21B|nr:hypothetical protein [Kitasatospora purpeofusca]MDY0816083.1 hypothetical protein [Kitasatospora purpeofusca]
MGRLDFDRYSLNIRPRRRAVSFIPGFGAHRLTVNLECTAAGTWPKDAAHSVTGALWAADLPRHSGWLGHLVQLEPLKAAEFAVPTELEVTLTDAQLAALEQARSGADLRLRLDMVVTALAPTGKWPARNLQEQIDIPDAEWSKEVTEIGHGAFVTVLVPITDNTGRATAARRLREAQTAIRAGDFETAVAKARTALDAVRPPNHQAAHSQAVNKKAKDRTQDERWTMLLQAAYDLFGGAHHDDPGTTEHFTWSRADAVTAIATTSGLLSRLDEQP